MAERVPLPRVKVCGMTRAEDVLGAVESGADAVGFVHHGPSPRSIDASRARELIDLLPPGVLCVAVLVDAEPDAALEWATRSGATWVQLCGSEQPDPWRDFPLPVLRRVGVDDRAGDELDRWSDIAAGFVLDHPSTPGGSGRGVDRELAASLARHSPCLLAGGLHAGNVAEVVHSVRPDGVDASSCLEQSPGQKSAERVRAFVHAALNALEGQHR